MKQHLSTILLAVLGLVVSLTLLLSILYSNLSDQQNLTTKLRQIDQSHAQEQNQQK